MRAIKSGNAGDVIYVNSAYLEMINRIPPVISSKIPPVITNKIPPVVTNKIPLPEK
jgi:hypothetical protein